MMYVYRFRLYPKKEQIEFLNSQMGHCRFVYNKLLEIAKKDYEVEGKKWNYYEYKRLLPRLKEEFLSGKFYLNVLVRDRISTRNR